MHANASHVTPSSTLMTGNFSNIPHTTGCFQSDPGIKLNNLSSFQQPVLLPTTVAQLYALVGLPDPASIPENRSENLSALPANLPPFPPVFSTTPPTRTKEAALLLSTPRTQLLPWDTKDTESLHHFFCLPEVRRFLCDDKKVSRETVEDWQQQSEESFRQGEMGLWKIVLREAPGPPTTARAREDGTRWAGVAGFFLFFEPPVRELMFALEPALWGQGLAYEAAAALIDARFQRLPCEEILASTDAPNLASLRLLRRLEMHETGREAGPLGETIHFALPRTRWENRQK